jgi:hypothetical protein
LDWILPILQTQAAGSLERLAPIALGIVVELATNNSLQNAEKRDIAVTKLATAAKSEGIAVGLSLLNLAVELAVAKLKTEK